MLEEVKTEFQATFERTGQITERLSRDISTFITRGYLICILRNLNWKHPDINRVLLLFAPQDWNLLLKIRLKHLFSTLEVVATMGHDN